MLIRFDCPNCGNEIEREVEDAAYDISGETEYEREGREISHVECICDPDDVFEIQVVAEATRKTVELIGHPDIDVKFVDLQEQQNYWYDDFLENYEPSDAHEVYLQSLSELKTIENSAWLRLPNQALLRVMYLQYVVILEAYLRDRLINIIMDDSNKMLGLISRVDVLNNSSHTLIEISKEPDIVKKTVKGFLQRVSFHDLMLVSQFYEVVLGVNIFSDTPLPPEIKKKRKSKQKQKSGETLELTPAEEEMMSIIETRHHLVHRNGRDNEGKLIEISVKSVERVKQLIFEMVDRVEQVYSEYSAKRALGDQDRPKL
ncbi:hypothetical protein EN837_05595 [bacterium M00.F.Ca.ET.194.01.1.1]|uniref:hypothetical protein n=1 Tax=Agrobacterium pusense TaxID=648995 RepID=UPI001092A46C|nr:hypothetical protein [Agrobacterium pusense]TGR70922.1 hypothetical protein EN837_05595 [bacterium M00.F.Ca.ET.194.01.1.1]TGS55774.1 hypothetical protein EN822_05595 [bacterium M00.F.Ca.ET.179.01.1.1]TGV48684.1 hypothetical protein EN811_05595 [bacterium M00.F.Ca.ET.168.01.1.1]